MNTFWLRDFRGAARARQRVRALADALGAEDGAAVEQVAAELACNCVEHRSGPAAARLRCYRCGNRLVVETLNQCADAPDWHSRKDDGTPYRLGGRGLNLIARLADRFRWSWERHHGKGYVQARAEFPLRRQRKLAARDNGARPAAEQASEAPGGNGAAHHEAPPARRESPCSGSISSGPNA